MKPLLELVVAFLISFSATAGTDWAWNMQSGYTGQVDLGTSGSVSSLSTMTSGSANLAGNGASQPPLVVNVQAASASGSSKRVDKRIFASMASFNTLMGTNYVYKGAAIALNDKVLLPFYYYDTNNNQIHYELGVQLLNADGTANGSPVTYASSSNLLMPFNMASSGYSRPPSIYQTSPTQLIVMSGWSAFFVTLSTTGNILSTVEINPPSTGTFTKSYYISGWNSLDSIGRGQGIIDNGYIILPRIVNNNYVGLFKFDLTGVLVSSMSPPLTATNGATEIRINKADFGYVVSAATSGSPAGFNALSIDSAFSKIISSGSNYNIYNSSGTTTSSVALIGSFFDPVTNVAAVFESNSDGYVGQAAIPFNSDGARVNTSYTMLRCAKYMPNGSTDYLGPFTGLWGYAYNDFASDTSPDGRPFPRYIVSGSNYNYSRPILVILNKFSVTKSSSAYYETIINADIEAVEDMGLTSTYQTFPLGTNSPDLSVVAFTYIAYTQPGVMWYKFTTK